MFHQLTGYLPRQATVPDNDSRPDHGYRNTRRAKLVLNLPPAAQVGGEFVLVAPEPAEIDDAGQSGRPCAHCKHGGALAVPTLEVRRPQRVHQVTSRLATGHGPSEAGTVLDVAQDRSTRSSIEPWVASHGDHVVSRRLESWAQPPADEAGRSGNEHPHRRTAIASLPARFRHSRPRGIGSRPAARRLDGMVVAGRRWERDSIREFYPKRQPTLDSGRSRRRFVR